MSETELTLDFHCAHCGYSLRGIRSERCPECGNTIDWTRAGQSPLPWNDRQRLGQVNAFSLTAQLAIIKPQILIAHMAQPVDLRSAILFRRAAVLTAFVPLAITLALAYFVIARQDHAWIYLPTAPFSLGTQPWLLLVTLFSIWLFLMLITGAPFYFCRPSHLDIEQQNRAVAILHYASAPWILLGPAIFLAAAYATVTLHFEVGQLPFVAVLAAAFIAGSFIGIMLVLIVWRPIQLIRACTRSSALHASGVGFLLAMLWLLAALVAALPVAGFLLLDTFWHS